MLGRLLHRFRTKYGRGLRVAYYRDRVRPRILETAPCRTAAEGACEIHVLTSSKDWLNLVWALKSFYWASGRDYPLCIHDDGSLQHGALAHLRRLFPDARLIERRQADQEASRQLQGFPRCREFRDSNQLAPKVFDFARDLRGDRLLLLDSDVLFFAEPTELLRRVEDPSYLRNTVNGDVDSAYTVDPQTARERLGVELLARFNSGLGLVHRDSLRLEWFEEFLATPGIVGHMWRIEQTLLALASCRFGCDLLPPEYDVYLTRGLGQRPSRHYVGAVRHLMFCEGMARLTRDAPGQFTATGKG